ncbi:MAG TPA: T9SS type A sorting domain-containing protein, partial [Balneolaceae bacterium]|nr:T9SS type A sorting domain-containing protein [Balneolaceae bacterium]
WYLISGPGTSVAFADINDPGSILVAGSLKAYDNVNGYVDASTLEPGRGYWVQADATGTITISSDVTASATKRVAKQLAEPEGFASFRISTNERDTPKFYLGGSLNEDGDLNPLSFSMPPLPPGDAFDVRFDNDSRLVNGNSGTLLVRSPGDSLTISHTNQTNDELEFSFTREGSVEVENYEIIPDQSLTISSEGISEINVQVGMASSVDDNVEKPNRIELSQNFPNPFNPSTVISYTLPEAGSVSLEVFDMTGRRIAVLAQGNQAAGAYTYDFDASSLSSGVYMYRLQSAGTVLTRKMTLIK